MLRALIDIYMLRLCSMGHRVLLVLIFHTLSLGSLRMYGDVYGTNGALTRNDRSLLPFLVSTKNIVNIGIMWYYRVLFSIISYRSAVYLHFHPFYSSGQFIHTSLISLDHRCPLHHQRSLKEALQPCLFCSPPPPKAETPLSRNTVFRWLGLISIYHGRKVLRCRLCRT